MKPCLRLLPCLAVSWCCLWALAQAAPAPKTSVRLEFRRAETEPAEGLEETTDPSSGKKIYLHKTAEVTAEDIATASIEKQECEAYLKLVFTEKGKAKVEKLTKEHRDKPMAVLLDGKLLAAPIIYSTITEQAVLTKIGVKEMEKIVNDISRK